MRKRSKAYGYYHITLRSEGSGQFIGSNSERAFIIAQLQYFLSPRLILGDIPAHRQLASCIDLLAFSIKADAIHLLIFSIDVQLSRYLTQHLIQQLHQYRSEQNRMPGNVSTPLSTIEKLTGPHQALARTVTIHLLHEDWEYDRYSSIGFYLHDRRGDWMRTWRLTRLYDNTESLYLELLHSQLYQTTAFPSADVQHLAQEAHG